MKYLVRFNETAQDEIDIKSCFIELIDDNFEVQVQQGYLKFVRHAKDVEKGIMVKVSKVGVVTFVINNIVDILEVSAEFLEEKYNLKLDYITVVDTISNRQSRRNFSYDKETFDKFSEIDKDLTISSLYIHFRPINNFDKIKTYIKNKLK